VENEIGKTISMRSLQKSFHLCHPYKIELKKISSPTENKKHATEQTNDRQKSVAMQIPKPLSVKRFNYSVDRRPACNTSLVKVLVQRSTDTFVVNQSLVLHTDKKIRRRLKFCKIITL
jgi:hypothetical protein